MAEQVFKKITELDTLSGSLDGSETMPIVKAGKTYRRSWSAFFGSGWAANILQAFTAFKSPDSVHADDADTVGGQDTATLHSAPLLSGNIHLDRIPAELTGKNAATATLAAACSGNAATATLAAACSGNAATATTAAACSGNAATAGGIDFANGNSGTSGNKSVAAGSPWVIPKGTYFMSGNSFIYPQFQYSSGVWSGISFGFIVSDGINFRIVSTDGTNTVYYRKLN